MLKNRAKDLKETSDELLKSAEEAEKDLQGIQPPLWILYSFFFLIKEKSLFTYFSVTGESDKLTDLKKRLTEADKKKKDLEKDLLDAQNQLNEINRGREEQLKD